jgi:hypothetical protein
MDRGTLGHCLALTLSFYSRGQCTGVAALLVSSFSYRLGEGCHAHFLLHLLMCYHFQQAAALASIWNASYTRVLKTSSLPFAFWHLLMLSTFSRLHAFISALATLFSYFSSMLCLCLPRHLGKRWPTLAKMFRTPFPLFLFLG